MKLLLIIATAAAALPALAQPYTLAVDSRHTFPSYEIMHNGYAFQRGRFNKTTGTITIDLQAKKGSADIAIDATSVSTGVEKLEEHIRSDDFLKTKANPQIIFKSSQLEFEGDKLRRVVGELTMAGVTRPVTLDATFEGLGMDPWGKQRSGFAARTEIDRRDWGLRWNQALEAGGVLVANSVKIEIEAQAVKQDAEG